MKKKIAYIISRFPTVSETFILYEMLELTRLGMDIDVFPLIHQPGSVVHTEVAAIAPKVHYYKYLSLNTIRDHSYWFRAKPKTYLQTIAHALLQNVRSPKFFSRAVIVVLLSARFARKIKELEIQHIHAHAATHPTLMAYIVSRLTDVPYSFTAHSSDIYFNQTMLGEKIRQACFVVTISKYNVDFLNKNFPDISLGKLYVIHCGIDPAKFKMRTEKRASGPIRVICVGRLETIKGLPYLIEACARLKSQNVDFLCQLVGDGELQSRIQKDIQRLGLERNVELLGFQTHDKVVDLLNQADVLVLPSLSEGIPVAVMEGMASSLPVVATAVTGVPELVQEGVTGFLVPSRDSQALSHAIAALARSPELRLSMGKAGREKVVREFNLQNSAAELYRVILDS
jgi:colanic acid/amylovoran biosynthesis glycosyltransferase